MQLFETSMVVVRILVPMDFSVLDSMISILRLHSEYLACQYKTKLTVFSFEFKS